MEPLPGQTEQTPGCRRVSTKRQRIAALAKQMPGVALTNLAQYLDEAWMLEAYQQTRKSGAVGVDEQTAQDYAQHLQENLRGLLERVKAGTYRAPPVRRTYIPKGTKRETRPIGIPTFEDKVLQRAIVMLLEPVYEQDFLDCSYGFRPNRSPRQAVEVLWETLMRRSGGWVLELDIRKFFDTLRHEPLRQMVRQRVRDGVVLRLISKWLHAGVMEDGAIHYPEMGSPQGGVISPTLANVYLHEVLDTWFEREVQPRLEGWARLVRFADDAVMVFQKEVDARRVLAVLPKRFERYGLALHPDKTRLVAFGPPPPGPNDRKPPQGGHPTFDFLGFTHYWGRTRKGGWAVKRKTASDRLSRFLVRLSRWCRTCRHEPVRWQQEQLRLKLRGHYTYYGTIGNSRSIQRVAYWADRIWRKWLSRRSDRSRFSWGRFSRMLQRYPLPAAHVVARVAVT